MDLSFQQLVRIQQLQDLSTPLFIHRLDNGEVSLVYSWLVDRNPKLWPAVKRAINIYSNGALRGWSMNACGVLVWSTVSSEDSVNRILQKLEQWI